MTTYKTQDEAEQAMKDRNRTIGASNVVLVQGPGDDEFTVMDIREAIENDFAYSWQA